MILVFLEASLTILYLLTITMHTKIKKLPHTSKFFECDHNANGKLKKLIITACTD